MSLLCGPVTSRPLGASWCCQLHRVVKSMPTTLRWRHNGHDSVSNHQPHDCLLNLLFWRRSKKTSKLCVTGLCMGNSPGTGEFPAQMASYAENVSIWWRHHAHALHDSTRYMFFQSVFPITVLHLDNTFDFPQNTHHRHPIARARYGCLLWAWSLISVLCVSHCIVVSNMALLCWTVI